MTRSDMSMLPTDLRHLHVLVVDDSEVVRTQIEHMLKTLGVAQITCAPDVASAHRALRSVQTEVHFVICDEIMPGASGLEFLKVIRLGRIPQLQANIPFILCTGSDEASVEVAAANLDVIAFLKKPVGIEILRETLERTTRRLHGTQTKKYEDVPLPRH